MFKEGSPPAADSLATIARVENASLTWLLQGKGQPFLVASFATDAEVLDYLNALLEDEGEAWQVHHITDGQRHALALTQPGQFTSKGKTIDYTILELITGAIGTGTLERISTLPVRRAKCTREQMAEIYRGRMGTWRLVNAPGALLNTDRAVAEPTPDYNIKDAIDPHVQDQLDMVTDEVLALLDELGMDLPADKQARLIVTIYRRLLRQGDQLGKDEMKELIKLAR